MVRYIPSAQADSAGIPAFTHFLRDRGVLRTGQFMRHDDAGETKLRGDAKTLAISGTIRGNDGIAIH